MKKFILKKMPLLFALLLFALAMPLAWFLLNLLVAPLGSVWSGAMDYGLTIVIVVGICFFCFRELPFPLKGEHFFKGLFTFGLLGIIVAVIAFVMSYETIDLTPTLSDFLGCLLLNAAIAVSEEFLFRGVFLNVFLNAWKGKKGFVWTAVFVSSALFGLRHLLNLAATSMTPILTIGQVFFTFMAGVYLCAVYLRTKNIWIVVVIHFTEDFLTGLWPLFSSAALASSLKDAPLLNVLGLVALQSVYVWVGVIMLKDKKWHYEPLKREDKIP
jgi:hypothetical protein